MSAIQTSSYYKYLSALLAFLLWGGWAFYINENGESYAGVISGFTQGCYSFTVTLLMTHFIAFQFNIISNVIFRIALPPVITVCVTGCMLVIIHLIAGTPSILVTVMPPLTVAFLFSILTVYKLYLASRPKGIIND